MSPYRTAPYSIATMSSVLATNCPFTFSRRRPISSTANNHRSIPAPTINQVQVISISSHWQRRIVSVTSVIITVRTHRPYQPRRISAVLRASLPRHIEPVEILSSEKSRSTAESRSHTRTRTTTPATNRRRLEIEPLLLFQ